MSKLLRILFAVLIILTAICLWLHKVEYAALWLAMASLTFQII